MEYGIIQHSQLSAVAASWAGTPGGVLPISPARALSWSRNPYALPTDPALFLARDGSGVLRGFLGSMPDCWRVGSNELRCAWLSTFWVDPGCRGQGIGRRLLNMAAEAWPGQLALTEFSPEAEALYRRHPALEALPDLEGCRYYRRPDFSGLVQRRWPAGQKLAGCWAALDRAAGYAIRLGERMRPGAVSSAGLSSYSPRSGMRWELCALGESLPEEGLLSLLEDRALCGPASRDAKGLRWMLDYPWLEQGEPDARTARYPFSSRSAQIQRELWVLRSEGSGACAVLALQVRNGLLKPFYLRIPSGLEAHAAALLRWRMQVHDAHTLLVFDPALRRALDASSPGWLHRRRAVRSFYLSPALASVLREAGFRSAPFSDGDGDTGFT